jgi:hypothetical protein
MGTFDLPAVVGIEQGEGPARVSISGNLGDQSDLSAIAALKASHVIVDLTNLLRINSRGVVLWLEMIESLCANVKRVEIHNASHAFVNQYMMVSGFAGTARIESVQATFLCKECGDTAVIILERNIDFPHGTVEPQHIPECGRCHRMMAPDDPIFDIELPR